MRVVFLEEVEGTARTGDVKNVADGFARNFLLPRKLAAPATDHYITIAQAKAGKEARRQERRLAKRPRAQKTKRSPSSRLRWKTNLSLKKPGPTKSLKSRASKRPR